MSWWTPLFCGSCQGEKPGGLALTDRGAELCRFTSESRLLDVASGSGETVRHLRARLGCEIQGLDQAPACQSPDVTQGRAEQLPWEDGSFHGVLLECALSQIEAPEQALRECFRVLRPGGRLLLTDLYTRAGPGAQTSLGRLDSREGVEKRLRDAGLEPIYFEDHTRALTQLWAGALMAGTGEGLYADIHRASSTQGIKWGYFLCIGEKPLSPRWRYT